MDQIAETVKALVANIVDKNKKLEKAQALVLSLMASIKMDEDDAYAILPSDKPIAIRLGKSDIWEVFKPINPTCKVDKLIVRKMTVL